MTGLIKYNENLPVISPKQRWMMFGICLSSFILILTIFYLIFLPDETNGTIAGMQGRYLHPLAPVFFLLLCNSKIKFKTPWLKYFVLISANYVLFVSFIRILYRFYV
jgi:uncharacterized membrane protein